MRIGCPDFATVITHPPSRLTHACARRRGRNGVGFAHANTERSTRRADAGSSRRLARSLPWRSDLRTDGGRRFQCAEQGATDASISWVIT